MAAELLGNEHRACSAPTCPAAQTVSYQQSRQLGSAVMGNFWHALPGSAPPWKQDHVRRQTLTWASASMPLGASVQVRYEAGVLALVEGSTDPAKRVDGSGTVGS